MEENNKVFDEYANVINKFIFDGIKKIFLQ